MIKGRKKIRFDISLWVVISAVAVLIVITTVMAMAQLERQKEKAVEIFVEKGDHADPVIRVGIARRC